MIKFSYLKVILGISCSKSAYKKSLAIQGSFEIRTTPSCKNKQELVTLAIVELDSLTSDSANQLFTTRDYIFNPCVT
jgi:hypothetical protein